MDAIYPASFPDEPNLACLMFRRAREWPERPMLRWHRDGAWHAMRWGEFGRAAAAAARAFAAAGIAPGDRVLMVSENRPEFPIAETALMAIGALPVPAYVTNTVADHAHVLRDSGARAAVVSTATLAARVAQAATQAVGLDLLVHMEAAPDGDFRALAWPRVVGDATAPDDVAAAARAISSEAPACLIYTSGTGGAPKGVILPHRAILANCRGALELLRPLRMRDELYLSFLPLSHSFEHTAGQFFLLSVGTEVAYARGAEHLAADMLAVRPTIMTVVPRVLEVIRGRVLAQVERQPAWRQALFHRAVALGARRASGVPIGGLQRVADAALERLVRRKVRARFGGRLRALVSGGARLEPEVGRFFQGLGLVLMQGYGQTEAGPVIAANPPDAVRIETVGPPLQGVELRLAEDGEILVRGGLVMQGYWGRPEDTEAVIRDGWLHTGDVGELDAAGYLRITDRKRDLIVLSGGENIAPARIEAMLTGHAPIAQALVFGDGRPALSALLVAADGADEAAVGAAVAAANRGLAVTERIRRHALIPACTVENGLLTPTQKLRRQMVLRAHAALAATLLG
jgi:long-chain acyl-CoA synthetase